MSEDSEEYFYPSNLRQKFIDRLKHRLIFTKEPSVEHSSESPVSKSADELIAEYTRNCRFCGFSGIVGTQCSCGGEPLQWTDSAVFSRFLTHTNTPDHIFDLPEKSKVAEMSWTELRNALSTFSAEKSDANVNPDFSDKDDDDTDKTAELSDDEGWPEIDTPLFEEQSLSRLAFNYNALVNERDMLISQLQQCEERLDHVQAQKQQLEDALEEKGAAIVNELILHLDDFSQAVQILLVDYCDIEDLFNTYSQTYQSIEEIKHAIIVDAKLRKKQQMMINPTHLPKNHDGLPNLYDRYITDSYY